MSDQSQFRNAMTAEERMAAKLIIETGKLEEECFSLARFALTLPEAYRRELDGFVARFLAVNHCLDGVAGFGRFKRTNEAGRPYMKQSGLPDGGP